MINGIVADAKKLLGMVDSHDDKALQASALLSKLLLQDIEETKTASGEPVAKIKEGTTKDRVPSATDPDQRHGRKSSSKKFVGSKASIAVEIDSQIITAVDVIPGNAGDAHGALELVAQTEENTDRPVVETLADCAYGGGETRQAFADAERELLAKVPKENGRTINVHPQELLIRRAREYQQTQEGRDHLRERGVVEHRLARLGQLGTGQARYIGTQKMLFQLTMAATVANFRWTWNWAEAQNASAQSELSFQAALQGIVSAIWAVVAYNILHMLSRFVRPAMRAHPIWSFS